MWSPASSEWILLNSMRPVCLYHFGSEWWSRLPLMHVTSVILYKAHPWRFERAAWKLPEFVLRSLYEPCWCVKVYVDRGQGDKSPRTSLSIHVASCDWGGQREWCHWRIKKLRVVQPLPRNSSVWQFSLYLPSSTQVLSPWAVHQTVIVWLVDMTATGCMGDCVGLWECVCAVLDVCETVKARGSVCVLSFHMCDCHWMHVGPSLCRLMGVCVPSVHVCVCAVRGCLNSKWQCSRHAMFPHFSHFTHWNLLLCCSRIAEKIPCLKGFLKF